MIEGQGLYLMVSMLVLFVGSEPSQMLRINTMSTNNFDVCVK